MENKKHDDTTETSVAELTINGVLDGAPFFTVRCTPLPTGTQVSLDVSPEANVAALAELFDFLVDDLWRMHVKRMSLEHAAEVAEQRLRKSGSFDTGKNEPPF